MGLMKPIAARLLRMLKTAKTMTIIPVVLKKIPLFEISFILKELKLMRAKTGRVPSAKASMVNPPARKLPVERV